MSKTILAAVILITSIAVNLEAEYVTVTDIVDGDTIIVNGKTRVQLLGVDAFGNPEGTKQERELDRKATEFTMHFLLGKRVEISKDSNTQLNRYKDKWGRVLAYVQYEDGTLFNKEIIEQGYASAYMKYPLEYAEVLKEAEEYAKKWVKGLWYIINRLEKTKKVHRVIVTEKGSKFYHDASCKIAKEIPLEERITFHDEDEAKKLGYYRGSWCLPILMKNFDIGGK